MPSPAPGPQDRGHGTAGAGSELLTDFSLGMTAKLGELEQARAVIPPGTRVHVGFVDTGDPAARVAAARAIKEAGFVPVPVIAARRLRSEAMLREYLAALQAAGASGSVLIVAGDPAVSAPTARNYGFSLAAPAGTAAPGRFIRALASGYDPQVHGEVKLHFNPFGGFTATAEWISRFCAG